MRAPFDLFEAVGAPLPHVRWPLKPAAGESLAGFTVRTCQHNGLWKAAKLTYEAGLVLPRGIGSLPRLTGDLNALAVLLNVDISWIEEQRHPPVKSRRRQNSFVDFHGATLRRPHFDYTNCRVSPKTLKLFGHHRDVWNVVTLPICLNSGEFLVEHCPDPDCRERLRWNVGKALGCCQNPDCSTTVDDLPSVAASKQVRAGLMLAGSLLDTDRSANDKALRSLPKVLRNENRGDIFELSWILGCLAERGGHRMISNPRLVEPELRATLLAQGATRLKQWPDCVSTLFRETLYKDGEGELIKETFLTAKAIIRNPTMFGRSAELLNEAVPESDLSSYVKVIAKDDGLLTATEFAAAAHLSSSRVAQLQRNIKLAAFSYGEGDFRKITLFTPKIAIEVRDAVRDRLSAHQFSVDSNLGIDAVEIIMAGRAGFASNESVIQCIWDEKHVNKNSATRLLSDIAKAVRHEPAPFGSIRILEALYGCNGLEKPWLSIIDAILTGSVSIYNGDSKSVSVRDLLVSPKDVIALRSFRDAPLLLSNRSEMLNEADARERLSTTGRRLRSLSSAGLLTRSTASAKMSYYRSEIDDLAKRRISTLEIEAKLNLDWRTARKVLEDAHIEIDEHRFASRLDCEKLLSINS